MVSLDPTAITVREGLSRYRQDMNRVKELAQSIKDNGQIQPIIITKQRELIAGGRRLAACIYLSAIEGTPFKVKAIYNEATTDDELRKLEIVENIERENFTPAEEELAIAELHRIMMKEKGVKGTSSTPVKKEWNMEKTAVLLNISPATVSRSIKNAAAIAANPELMKCASKGEIKNKAEKTQRLVSAKEAVKKAEAAAPEKKKFTINCQDVENFMLQISDRSIDIVVTDPPYAISIMEKRAVSSEVDGYDDSMKANEYLFKRFPAEVSRVLTEFGAIYMFIGSEHFQHFIKAFEEQGMKVYWKEIIWIKGTAGQTNRPDMWPGDCYEKILFARKVSHRLIKEGMPNWIQCDPLKNKVHQAEKPVKLIENLLYRSCIPKQTLIDPFCGSGAILEAGAMFGLNVSGCDINADFVALAKERMLKYEK